MQKILQERETALEGGKVKPFVFPIEPETLEVLKEYQHRHARLAAIEKDSEAALENKFLQMPQG